MTTTEDGFAATEGAQIPLDLPTAPTADTTARPNADAAPRAASARRTVKRKPLPRSTVALAAVAGTGAAAVVVTGLAVTAGPVAALAAALGVPMTVAARMLTRGGRNRTAGRRTAARRRPGTTRRKPARTSSGLNLPRLPKFTSQDRTGKPASRTAGTARPKGNGRSGGMPKLAAFGSPGLPKDRKATPGARPAASAKTPSTGAKTPGPRTAANGGRTPKGGPRPARTPSSGAGVKPPRVPKFGATRRGASSSATPGTGRGLSGPRAAAARKNAAAAHGAAGIPHRATRRGLRTPRTRMGHYAQQKRLADQEKYLAWWSARPAAIRKATRTAGAKTVAGMGTTGKAAAAGFKGSAKPRQAAKSAYQAARTNRRPGVRGQVGSVAAGVLGAGLAAGARGTANRAKPIGRVSATAGRAAAKRYRKIRREAARRSGNLFRRLIWVATGNQEALTADRARAARRAELRTRMAADKTAARKEKYAVQRPAPGPAPQVPARPAPPQRPATAQPTQARPVVTLAPRPNIPINEPVRDAGSGLTGGTTMSNLFHPYRQAIDLGGALMKWGPGTGEGALFALYDQMPKMRNAAHWIVYGWIGCFNSITQDLNTALSGAHIKQKDQALKLLGQTVPVFDEMIRQFERIHAHDLERRAIRNAQVTNVDTVKGGEIATDFPAWGAAEQYGKALIRWRPGIQSGALFTYYDAIEYMAKSQWLIANGWAECIKNTNEELRGGLDPAMAQALVHIYRSYVGAAEQFDMLRISFHKTHADDLERRHRAGAHTANVPARVH